MLDICCDLSCQMIKRKVLSLKYYEFKFNKNPEHWITYKDTNEIKEY